MTRKPKKFCRSLVVIYLCLPSSVLIARTQSERAQVNVEKIERQKPQTKDKAAESVSKAEMLGSLESELIQNIDQSLQYLNETVKTLPRGSKSRYAMFDRIINLSLEQAAYVTNEEHKKYAQAWDAWNKGGRKGKEPKVDNKVSDRYWTQIYTLAMKLKQEFATFPGVEALYFDGILALQFLGRNEEAVQELKHIIATYKKSAVIGEAHFALGEYYFDKHDFKKAQEEFFAAGRYTTSKRYGWTLFKIAWCYFNLAQYRSAIQYWKKTIDYSENQGGENAKRLKDEAMRDMVYAFAELGQVSEAIEYYKHNGGESFIPDLLRLMGQTYAEQGRFGKALAVWDLFAKNYPNHLNIVEAYVERASLSHELGQYSKIWGNLKNLFRVTRKDSSWAAGKTPEQLQAAQVRTERLLAYYPKILHKEGQKQNSKTILKEATVGYTLFLASYPNSIQDVEIKEYMADIAYFNEEYRLAGEYYFEIVQLGKDKAVIYDQNGKVKENIHARSAKNMLDSFNKDFTPELTALIKIKPDLKGRPKALSQAAKNFIRSCNIYIKNYPDDSKTKKNCEIFTGEIYYRNQHKKAALRYLWTIATKYSDSKEGLDAVNTLIPMYANNQKTLQKATDKLLAIPAYRKGEIGQKIMNLRRGIQYEIISKESSTAKRAKMYQAQAMASPNDKDADKLWNNAATDYIKAGKIKSAAKSYMMIVKKYPKSPLYTMALLQSGKLNEQLADLSVASSQYILFATQFPAAKEAPAARQQACFIEIALDLDASKVCKNFASLHPQEGIEAIEKLIELKFRKKKWAELEDIIENFYFKKFNLSANQKILAIYRLARGQRLTQALKNRILSAARSGKGVSGEALRHVGEVFYEETVGAYQAFMKMTLKGGNVNALQGSIQAMGAEIGKLEQLYAKVFSTQDSHWAISAFAKIGSAYQHFADQLKTPPEIPGANSSEVKAQLAGSVATLAEKAKTYYQTCIQTAHQFSVLNHALGDCINNLKTIQSHSDLFVEWVFRPDFIASPISEKLISEIQ